MGKYFPLTEMQKWFPDDFPEEAAGAGDRSAAPDCRRPIIVPTHVQGYCTRNWFGPFLLGPPRRIYHGWC